MTSVAHSAAQRQTAPAQVAAHVPADVESRVAALDWERIAMELDQRGVATGTLLTPDECEELAGGYDKDTLFRSRVVMARHSFGSGEYKYFAYPLPDIIAGLRTALYPQLAAIANRWNESLGLAERFPTAHRT